MSTILFNDKRWTSFDPKSKLEGTVSPDGLTLATTSVGGTDWWRSPERSPSNGPTLGFTRSSADSFEVSVIVGIDPQKQLCLFLRVSPTCWVKTGLEFDEDVLWNSVVVVNPYSDWSKVKRGPAEHNRFTIAYTPGLVKVYLGPDMIRQVKWFGPTVDNDASRDHTAGEVFVGIMTCSPKEGGARMSFREFTMRDGVRTK